MAQPHDQLEEVEGEAMPSVETAFEAHATGATQAARVANDRDSVDAMIQSWTLALRLEATNMLDLFLIHGAEPNLARLNVAELFSPARITAMLGSLPNFAALAPGSTFDLRAEHAGRGWGFLRADHRQEARRRSDRERPYHSVGAPPCADFLRLFMNLVAPKMDLAVVRRQRIEAEVLLRSAA